MGRSRWKRRPWRGSATVFTLLVIMLMSIVGLALVGRTAASVKLGHIQRDSSTAFNLAESGAEQGLLWLHQQPSPPAGNSPITVASTTLGSGRYWVVIVPDSDNGSSSGKLPHYLIRSTGIAGIRQETVQLYVQLKSFGSWAYFNHIESASHWYGKGMVIDGPVHSNNADGTPMNINWFNNTSPIFLDQVSVVASAQNYSPRPPSGETEYRYIYKQGIAGLSLQSFAAPLPPTTDRQKNAAWGGNSGFPSSGDVYVPTAGGTTSGGIYIVGDASIHFSVDSLHPTWQKIEVARGGAVYDITIQRDSNLTVVQNMGDGTTSTYNGTTNGVIYCTGSVTSLEGTLADNVVVNSTVTQRNSLTVATDVNNGRDVTITNNLVYRTTPDKTKSWSSSANQSAAILGIVTRNLHLAGGTAPTDLHVNAMIVAGGASTPGTEDTVNYDSCTPGNYYCLGGLIEYAAGNTGTIDSSTGLIKTGYLEHYQYDYRLITNPPPYFPTTNDYQRLSWQRISAGPYPGG